MTDPRPTAGLPQVYPSGFDAFAADAAERAVTPPVFVSGMEVHDEYIPDELFAQFTAHMPECTVELVVEVDRGDGAGVLVARRTNEPAKGEWFWPGGRLYKGEEVVEAVSRLGREELGVAVEPVELLGVHSHFWESSPLPGRPSRHTVNLVHRARLADGARAADIDLDDQHDDWRVLTAPEPGLHEYVREYVETYDLV